MNAAHAQQPQYAPEIEEGLDRITDALQHLRRDPTPTNAPNYQQPSLFYALELRRVGRDNMGRDWSHPDIQRYGTRLASLKNQLSGISGLSELMYADFQSRQDADAEEQFSEVLRERLFLALMELAEAANHNMEFIGDAVFDAANKRGGEAP